MLASSQNIARLAWEWDPYDLAMAAPDSESPPGTEPMPPISAAAAVAAKSPFGSVLRTTGLSHCSSAESKGSKPPPPPSQRPLDRVGRDADGSFDGRLRRDGALISGSSVSSISIVLDAAAPTGVVVGSDSGMRKAVSAPTEVAARRFSAAAPVSSTSSLASPAPAAAAAGSATASRSPSGSGVHNAVTAAAEPSYATAVTLPYVAAMPLLGSSVGAAATSAAAAAAPVIDSDNAAAAIMSQGSGGCESLDECRVPRRASSVGTGGGGCLHSITGSGGGRGGSGRSSSSRKLQPVSIGACRSSVSGGDDGGDGRSISGISSGGGGSGGRLARVETPGGAAAAASLPTGGCPSGSVRTDLSSGAEASSPGAKNAQLSISFLALPPPPPPRLMSQGSDGALATGQVSGGGGGGAAAAAVASMPLPKCLYRTADDTCAPAGVVYARFPEVTPAAEAASAAPASAPIDRSYLVTTSTITSLYDSADATAAAAAASGTGRAVLASGTEAKLQDVDMIATIRANGVDVSADDTTLDTEDDAVGSTAAAAAGTTTGGDSDDGAGPGALPPEVRRRLSGHLGRQRTKSIRNWKDLSHSMASQPPGYWLLGTMLLLVVMVGAFLFMAGQYEFLRPIDVSGSATTRGEDLTALVLSGGSLSSYNWGPACLGTWMEFWRSPSSRTFGFDYLRIWGGRYGPDLASGQWWRWVSSLLLHQSTMHLAANMALLLVLGSYLESLFGCWRMLPVWVVAGVAGNMASAFFENPCTLVVGSSGAVFGLLGAFVADAAINFESIPLLWLRLAGMAAVAALLVALQITGHTGGSNTRGSSTSHASHVGGFLSGGMLAWLLLPDFKARRSKKVSELLSASGISSSLPDPSSPGGTQLYSFWQRHKVILYGTYGVALLLLLVMLLALPLVLYLRTFQRMVCG